MQFVPQNTNYPKTIKKILSYYCCNDKKSYKSIIAAAIFEIINKGSNLSLPFFMKYIVDNLADPGKMNATKLLFVVASYGILWICSLVSKSLQVIFNHYALERSTNLLTSAIFQHVINLPLKFHLDKKTGSIINLINQVDYSFRHFIDGVLWQLIPLIIQILFAVSLVWGVYGFSYSMIIFIVIIAYFFSTITSAKISTKIQINKQAKLNEVSSYIVDRLLNYETIKSFNNEKYEFARCNAILEEKENIVNQSTRRMERVGIIQIFIVGIGLITLTCYSVMQIQTGILTVGDFVLLNTYILQFSLPMSYMGYVVRGVLQYFVSLQEIFSLFENQDDIEEAKNAVDLNDDKPCSVKLENVSFSYDNARLILNDISFSVEPGSTVAIVGTTGAGKSTISKLLFRFFDVQKGRILINDHDIRNITFNSLRRSIAIIPQDIILFNESLYFNILYGNHNASRDEVERAIRLAGLDNLVNSLPEGYTTMIGERGVKLSGGEKQRIAIARAILKNPKIYIFDEATASLDSNTEKEIQANLEKISQGITTIIIAHRLSTIIQANEIIVIENGSIVERGDHHFLLQQQGLYYKLWNKQTIYGD